jgi:hypothetical protein
VSAERSPAEVLRRAVRAPAGVLLAGGLVLAVLGLGFFAVLAAGADAGRAWRAFHVNFLFFTGAAQGAVVFAATQKITKGAWAGPIIRFAEATALFLPVALVLFAVLFLGQRFLFPWIEHPTPVRAQWLTVSWVFSRDFVALVVMAVITLVFVYHDVKPDAFQLREQVSGWRRALYDRIVGDYAGSADELATVEHRLNWLAPLLCILYAWLFSLLAFDLIMSLAPYWVSNLFGAFFFMGAFLTGLTGLGLMTIFWRHRLGMGQTIGREQFHDLGKLIFGFSVFWAYLMYSQLLVIWYGNLREETSFVFWRLWGEWRPIAILVGVMVFLVPFWGLIWVKAKTTPLTFGLFAAISFAGVWLERYLLVQPSFTERGPALGLPEIGITLGFLGLFLVAYGAFATALPMVSPRLLAKAEATGHH